MSTCLTMAKTYLMAQTHSLNWARSSMAWLLLQLIRLSLSPDYWHQ